MVLAYPIHSRDEDEKLIDRRRQYRSDGEVVATEHQLITVWRPQYVEDREERYGDGQRPSDADQPEQEKGAYDVPIPVPYGTDAEVGEEHRRAYQDAI